MCGGANAAPICPSSAVENAFIWQAADSIFSADSWWLGFYRNTSGMYNCVSGDTTARDYSNWKSREPDNFAQGGKCSSLWMYTTSLGTRAPWEDTTCDWGVTRYELGCICGSPLQLSDAFKADLASLEEHTEAHLTAFRAQVGVAYTAAGIVVLVPALVLLLLARLRARDCVSCIPPE